MNGTYTNSLRAWGYLVAALFGVVAVERGVQAPSSEVTVIPPAREEVSDGAGFRSSSTVLMLILLFSFT